MRNHLNDFGTRRFRPHSLPILTYHSIDESGSVISTPPRVFQRQIEHFAASQFKCTTLSEAWSNFKANGTHRRPMMALTFDDGLQSVYQQALPLLEKHGFRGTVFLVTELLGQNSSWLKTPGSIPRFPLMTEREIRELLNYGWEIGGHSTKHSRLTDMDDDLLEDDLARCRDSLQEMSSSAAFWFAYPYGVLDRRVKQTVGRFFRGACTTELAFADTRSDPLELERIDMYYLRDPRFYRGLGTTWFEYYLAFRRILRKIHTKATGESPISYSS